MGDSKKTGPGPGEDDDLTPEAPTASDASTAGSPDDDVDAGRDSAAGDEAWDDRAADGGGGSTGEELRAADGSEGGSRTSAAPYLVGALVGALALGLVWTVAAVSGDDEPSRASDRSTRPAAASLEQVGAPSVAGAPSGAPDTPDRCATAADRLAAAREAAAPAMQQWEVHVGAMNQLVVGAITLKQATDFWDNTRLGAIQRLDAFDAADAAVRRDGLDCPLPDRLGEASPALVACAKRVDADARAVALARTATRTWRHHVEDMDMLRMGHLSPAAATKSWLASWKEGVRQLDAYKAARAEARRAGRC